MKTLISWIGWLDFEGRSSNISSSAPNIDIHKKGGVKFDKHVLLSTGSNNSLDGYEELKAIRLFSKLSKEFKHCKFELEYLNIEDAFDFEEVYPKAEDVISRYKTDDIYVNFSIGTTTMRVIWALLAESNLFSFKLIFGRDPKQMKKGKSQFEQISFKLLSPEITTIESKPLNIEYKNTITPTLELIYSKAQKAARYDINILILGKTGTGKEGLANYIHKNSSRKNNEFIPVNCAAIGDELLESRLFGHRKGSFTGASSDQVGFFEKANKGSIFLDEIGDISSRMQQSLLRVIQERKIIRIGDTKTIDVDVRIICATNKNLLQEVKKGNFRADLYYRISEAELRLPSLNEYPIKEKKDIIQTIIKNQEKIFNKQLKFNKLSLQALFDYSFPGNFRELIALIKNIYIFNDESVKLESIEPIIHERSELSPAIKLIDIAREHVYKVYLQQGKNKVKTAEALGISPNTLRKHLGNSINTLETEQN